MIHLHMASVNLTDQVTKQLGYHHGAGLEWVQVNHILSAGRYQKLSNSIYCLRLIHDMNKYCLLPNSAKFS